MDLSPDIAIQAPAIHDSWQGFSQSQYINYL